jgi:DHA1 family bicyclomycin/chloramphenicol resistance-like MFS transporter
MFVAVVLNAALSGLLEPALPLSVLPIGLFSGGMASSCQSFLQVGLNAVSSAVAAPLLWSSTLSLAIGMAMFAALGLSAWLAWCRFGGRR